MDGWLNNEASQCSFPESGPAQQVEKYAIPGLTILGVLRRDGCLNNRLR